MLFTAHTENEICATTVLDNSETFETHTIRIRHVNGASCVFGLVWDKFDGTWSTVSTVPSENLHYQMVGRIKSLAPETARRASPTEIRRLFSEISRGNVLMITGAELSTKSGLWDYRRPGREMRRTPMHAQDFANNPISRKKYWAHSFAGYKVFAGAVPNLAHYAQDDLYQYRPEQLSAHITQNADDLLQRAGAVPKALIELHGTMAHITCGACGAEESRAAF